MPTLFLEWMTGAEPQTGWEAVGPISVFPLAATVLVTLLWLVRTAREQEVKPGLVLLVAAGGLHQTLSIGAHLLLPDDGHAVAWPALLGLAFAALVAAGGLTAARAAAREGRTPAQDAGLDG